jgi:rhodanese-related sulfurtransferase
LHDFLGKKGEGGENMKRKLMAIMTLLSVMLSLTLLLPTALAATHTNITPAQAYAMIYSNAYPNLLVIDVRTVTDYNNGHIIGAINVPIIPPSPFDFTAFDAWTNGAGQSYKDDYIIIYCGTGTRSNLAANKLDAAGFTHVYDMSSGTPTAYPGWFSANYPVVKVNALVTVQPDTLNLKSSGKWITCYIELASPNSVSSIVLSSVKMDETVAAANSPTAIGDFNYNSVPDLMVKFDRVAMQGLLDEGEIRLRVTFTLVDAKTCGGLDIIAVKG